MYKFQKGEKVRIRWDVATIEREPPGINARCVRWEEKFAQFPRHSETTVRWRRSHISGFTNGWSHM